MELATKLLLSILFATFFQNGSEATNPEMNELYRKMFLELSNQSAVVYYARAAGDLWLPVLSKLEMGRHIYAKIDLLEGILAELQAKRGQMEAEKEYFMDENTVGMFLEFVKKREGGEGHKAELFSDFPTSKLDNRSYFRFVTDRLWFMDELLGRKYPAEFFDILDSILAMKVSPAAVEKDTETDRLATYRPFQKALLRLIEDLKLEIVIGQTHNDFEDELKKSIEKRITKIQKKIDERGILSTALHPIKSHQQKKYEHLGEVSLKLYNVLKPQIRELINKKAKKEVAKLSDETVSLASEVKKTLKSLGFKTFLDSIHQDLCLPTPWLEEQKKLRAGADSEAHLRSTIHMNTAMLLLAYERVAKFYD